MVEFGSLGGQLSVKRQSVLAQDLRLAYQIMWLLFSYQTFDLDRGEQLKQQ